MRPSTPWRLAVLCAALCCAAAHAQAGFRRDLLLVGRGDDDDESFKFDFDEKDLSLAANSTQKFCFDHKVSCVEYRVEARQPSSGEPTPILALVAPLRVVERAQVDLEVANGSVLSLCSGQAVCDESFKVRNKDNLCLLVSNADFSVRALEGPDDEFSIGQRGEVVVDVKIEGCPTTSQRILAIAVPIAIFVGVAACFSTWWIRWRRRRPDPTAPPGSQQPQGAGQLPGSGSSGLPAAPPPLVTPAPGVTNGMQPVAGPAYGAGMTYDYQGGYGPQGMYGHQVVYTPGSANLGFNPGHVGAHPGYIGTGTRHIASADGYPIVVANV